MATNKNHGAGNQDGTQAVDETNKQASKDTYIVKDGDSLESVADENGMESVELVRLNPELAAGGSNNNLLYTGQEIRLK